MLKWGRYPLRIKWFSCNQKGNSLKLHNFLQDSKVSFKVALLEKESFLLCNCELLFLFVLFEREDDIFLWLILLGNIVIIIIMRSLPSWAESKVNHQEWIY